MAEDKEKKYSRTWGTLIYPESALDDWKTKVEELGIPCYISPLHDSDVLEDGSLKKLHYHLLFMFDGRIERNQFKSEVTSKIGSIGNEKILNRRSYIFYLTHYLNPEKHQYNPEDVICLNGAPDYIEIIKKQSKSKYELMKEIIEYSRNISSFASLIDYSINEKEEWFQLLCDSNCYLVKEYIKSKNYRDKYV